MKVIVIGAGIIGASTAWHLARDGADVTVVDAGLPAASSSSFGWINASFFADEAHHHLRAAGLAAYTRLSAHVPDLPIAPCGALWWEEQGAPLRAFLQDMHVLGYPVEALTSADLAGLEPDLASAPAEALRFPSEAALDPQDAARRLLMDARVPVVHGLFVQNITKTSQGIEIHSNIGKMNADHVVVCAGTGTSEILSSVDVHLPLLHRPGVLITTAPIRRRITHILVTPQGEARQLPDGRMLASAVAGHQGDASDSVTETPDELAARVLAWLSPLVGEDLRCDGVSIANRPMPADRLPVIGQAGPAGLHVAVMHSGVTLGAIAGEITAAEVLGRATNTQAALVAPYRPDRFQ